MVSEEVGGWVKDGEDKWCMLILDIILVYFPKEIILAHSQLLSYHLEKYMPPLNGTQNFRLICNSY